jgi:hypothetical protein
LKGFKRAIHRRPYFLRKKPAICRRDVAENRGLDGSHLRGPGKGSNWKRGDVGVKANIFMPPQSSFSKELA